VTVLMAGMMGMEGKKGGRKWRVDEREARRDCKTYSIDRCKYKHKRRRQEKPTLKTKQEQSDTQETTAKCM